MRILVADQNTLLLAAIAGTFGRHCVMVTATRRDACLEHLTQERFDVVVACEKLHDFTGLELLSEVQTLSPHTLRIFSAPAAHLARLGPRLDHFGLLGTLSYPIEPRKLLLALKFARTRLPARPKVRHVVLESEWDTGERLGILERELEVAPADPPILAAAPDSAPEAVLTTAPAGEPGDVRTAAPASDPDDIPVMESFEETSVSQVRRARDIPSGEESFEVSFDENPNRVNTTAPRIPVAKLPIDRRRAQEVVRTPTVTGAQGTSTATGSQGTPTVTRPQSAPTVPGPQGRPKAQSVSGAPAHVSTGPRPVAQRATGAHAAPNAHSTPAIHPASSARPGPSVHSASPGRPVLAEELHPDETADVPFDVLPEDFPVPANDPSVEAPPPPAPPPPPPVDTGGAANEPAFDLGQTGKAAAKSGSTPAATAKTQAAANTKKTAPSGPRQRKPSVPTAAQRAAFQRAVARRNAARLGLSSEDDTNSHASVLADNAAGLSSVLKPRWPGTQSLTDLARMATTKRPLAQTRSTFAPKQRVFVVGSGVAAVLLASVLAFQLTRSHSPTHHNRQAVAAQLFSPNTNLVAENTATEAPAQVFGPPPGQPEHPAAAPSPVSNLPQPQVFDPNTAPADPPPPPAFEHPGPMEPPSAGHYGPPGMQVSDPE